MKGERRGSWNRLSSTFPRMKWWKWLGLIVWVGLVALLAYFGTSGADVFAERYALFALAWVIVGGLGMAYLRESWEHLRNG